MILVLLVAWAIDVLLGYGIAGLVIALVVVVIGTFGAYWKSDAVALAMALFDPRLEVVAVTAVAGTVSPDQAVRNVQAIVDQLDPPRFPRVGRGGESSR